MVDSSQDAPRRSAPHDAATRGLAAPRGAAHPAAAAARATATAPAATAIGSSAIIACPGCRTRFRLSAGDSRRAVCRACGAKLVVRRCSELEYRADLESDETLAGMICDWLSTDPSSDDDSVPAAVEAARN